MGLLSQELFRIVLHGLLNIYIYQCKHSKQKIVILKLDFTKAFDTIEHFAILEMMKTLGFNKEWL
jgi:hypothetical protein